MRDDLFARRLSEILRMKRVKGKELAEKLGVSARTVSRWVTGAGGVPLNRLSEIFEALGVTDKEFWDPAWTPDMRVPIGPGRGSAGFRPGPYLGIPTNEDGLALECPRCGVKDYSPSSKYCRGCAYPMRNLCTSLNPKDRHQNVSEAAFCEECARPTFWSLEYVTLDEILGRSEIRIPRNEGAEPNTP